MLPPRNKAPLVFPKTYTHRPLSPCSGFFGRRLLPEHVPSPFFSLPSRACSLQTRPNTPHYPNIPIPPAFSTFQGSHLKAKRWQVTKVTTEVTEEQPHVRQLSKHKTHSDHLVGWLASWRAD